MDFIQLALKAANPALVAPDTGRSDANEAEGPKTETEAKAAAKVRKFHFHKKGSALSQAVKSVGQN